MFPFSLFGWKRRLRKLRKKWDREREKALKKQEPLRGQVLQKLDIIAPTLVTLEEKRLHRPERARLSKEVEITLAEIEAMLKQKQ